MNNTAYVTTAIPYVNARPHVGYALELVQADAIARYYRLLGRQVRLQTGTDENAFKNVLIARAAGVPVQELVDRNSELYRQLARGLNISADKFIRTTSDEHRKGVVKFWESLAREDIYVKRYKGLYCVGCEDFYLEKDLVNGLCPDHGTRPSEVEEENYFFRLSRYQETIERLIECDKIRVVPQSKKKEVLNFVSGGLQDISISRPRERSGGWGIEVPGDPCHVIYVWIDALINYLSGLGYGSGSDWQLFWNPTSLKVHVIGKNVWKFHAVYWPALLISAGLDMPNEVMVHGFLTENGQKISKSRGNTIDPNDLITRFGADAVRHYLLRAVSPFGDSDFSEKRLAEVYTSDLANGLGNLVSRLCTLAARAGYQHLNNSTPSVPPGFAEAMCNYDFAGAIEILWSTITRLNQDIDAKKPWEALKNTELEPLHSQLKNWIEDLRITAYWLKPFMPNSSDGVLKAITDGPIKVAAPLFPRLRSGT